MSERFSVVGQGVVRKDAIEKVTGQARYISDIQLPGMLHAKFLRSPHAHARIVAIDTSRAAALPGVKCILTHQDVPQIHPLRRLELLLDQTVHHPGEEVAAVAALTPEIAEEALGLIEVQYQVLPAVVDFKRAAEPGADLAYEDYGSNVYHGSPVVKIPRLDKDGWLHLQVGNVEKGFAEADFTLEGTFETPIQYNCSPMPRAVVCEWQGDKLTCWADTQLPLYLWRDLAGSLNLPQANVRLISNYAVGGYGGKSPEKTAVLAALLSRKTGRPVKVVFSRSEDFIGTHHRISYLNFNKLGVKKDGSITAVYSRIDANWGSDSSSPFICQATALLDACTMLYQWQNSLAEGRGILTNILGHGSMNGFGDPEAIYSLERLIDEAAEKLDLDPVEFRYRNVLRGGGKALEYREVLNGPINWGVVGSDMDSFPELIRRCAEAAGWKEKWKGWRVPQSVDGAKRRGIGVAIGFHHTSFWQSSAIVKMNQDGTANVLSGAVEIGQGYATALAQVVAEVLGIRYEDVNPLLADTAATPASIGNVASTGVSSPVRAAQLAAEDARRKLFDLAAPRLQTTPDKLEARERFIWVKGTDNRLPIADVCLTGWQVTGTATNPPYYTIKDPASGKVIHAFAGAATVAEVEVDTETGQVRLLAVTSAHDCGRAINPVIIENQIDLGLVMANGWVRSEEYVVDPQTGVILNPNLLDYKLSTFLDIPESRDMKRIVVEKPCAWGPFGAKGMSETSMCALAPAMVNAVYNATGVRIYAGFLSPANVLSALERKRRI